MRKHSEMMLLGVFCIGLLFVTHTAEADSTPSPWRDFQAKPKFSRQNAIDENGGVDPFPALKGLMDKSSFDKFNKMFDSYLDSASKDDGKVKKGADDIMKVVGAVGSSAKKFKSGDALKVMSALMDVSAAIAGLVPGGEPFAILFSVISLALGFADQSKSEAQKMQEFITSALWDSRATVKQNDVKTFLRKNSDGMVILNGMIKDETDGKEMITLKGLEDAMAGEDISHYGSDEIESLWTVVKNNIDLPKHEKTGANGLKVYNMIYAYVRAAILRDITLDQFKTAAEMAMKRDCKGWTGRCNRMRRVDKNKMRNVYNNVRRKMTHDRGTKYCEVGEFLEQVLVKRSAVLIHHHPIGWSEQSTFIHDFALKHAKPSSASYQQSWVSKPKRKYMLQHVKRKWLHVEPEHQKLGGNDVLELENSNCLINYAVEFEKISDPENKERNGYFMMKQNKYDGWSGSSWNDPRYWRFYSSPTIVWWLRLELDISTSTIYNRVKTNSTNLANEYLFVVLEEEVNDEVRCKQGTKPKITIVPKRVRYVEQGYDMFITWKNSVEDEKKLVVYPTYGDYSEFYLHDCQGKSGCPGCHAETHIPESKTVDGRQCPP